MDTKSEILTYVILCTVLKFFKKYHREKIILPSKFLPDKKFLEYHNDKKFTK